MKYENQLKLEYTLLQNLEYSINVTVSGAEG